MKFSEKWLREWISITIDSNVLYDQISSSGIEVESVKKFESNFNGIVVGQIIQCVKHFKLKNLKLLKVDIGDKILNIFCKAPNCRDGIKVAVALVGAILPKNIKIEKKILHGEVSEGMLCSFFELGMFYSDKIIEFSQDTSIGINVHDLLSLKDHIIKTSTTSNRPDGLSILGLSRNIAALNNFKIPFLKYKKIPLKTEKKIDIYIKSVKERVSCLGRVIENINVNIETPFSIKKKLFFSDILPVNIITDIINYVLIEIGQPLNIFDIDDIKDVIIIRMANNKESIFLKNNTQLNLNKTFLVFSDKNKILSIPGNINASFLEINKNTKNIFLSSSFIDKKLICHIRNKVKSNKILEYYHYGIDPSLQEYAIEYATDLILKTCGGEAGPLVKSENSKCNSLSCHSTIKLYFKTVNKIIGCFIDKTIISNILYNLNYQIVSCQKEHWEVIPPTWRFDILIEEDVIADIIRIYGYDNIPLNPLKEFLNFRKRNKFTDFLLDKCAITLINKGYHEIITYGFIDPKIHDLIFPNKKKLLVSNPISQDMSCMRLSLWPGLLKTIAYNKNRQQKNIRLFEIGLCFLVDKKEKLGVKQEIFLASAISGDYEKESWFSNKRKVDFYDLKGDLECMLESICQLGDIEFRSEIISGLHPEQSASIYFKNNFIGKIGAIHPKLEKKLNINSFTFLFEISLNNFVEIKPSKIQEISKFPTSRRDLSILISKDIVVSDVINTCKKFFINQKVEINLFDIYSVKNISDQEKSLGISFIFQNMQKTLEDNEINLMMNNCIGVLKKKFQVILRK